MWGEMRTAAWETAPQVALRNCSKEAGGRSVYMRFWCGGVHAITHIFFLKVSSALMKPLLVVRSSHHHEGF